ncbi:two-partner secretion domain-containing protein [Solimonas soli]|uniref:two-partner secretion domain-containing protein n=1 Tax=Solimonas soli TaxID=413479 RepID=UPI000487D8CD|nr:filamentous hemagglutinin N-terminal domain-containing protein [Solimonas soli]
MTALRQTRIAAAVASLLPSLVLANPGGGTVVAGNVNIGGQGSQMVITQTSNSAIVNWNSFSVGADESVQFVQPNASSAILNRVTGGSPSNILGNIGANGRVFLVNSNGIVFGQGATVNVGSLIATTLDVDNGKFMNGEYAFTRGSAAPAGIVNSGSITADGGNVALIADHVSNDGYIGARYGRIALHAGSAFTLSFDEDGLINYEIDDIAAGSGGATSAQAGVSNSGTLEAAGGIIYMTAATAQNVARAVVNNSGTISATGISTDGGQVELTATTTTTGNGQGAVLLGAGGGDVELSGNIYGDTVFVVASGDIAKAADAYLYVDAGGLSVIAGRDIHLMSDGGEGYNSQINVHSGYAIGTDVDMFTQLQQDYPTLAPHSAAPNAGFQAGGVVELGSLWIDGGYLYARATQVSAQDIGSEGSFFYNYRPTADSSNINVDTSLALPINASSVTLAFGGTDYDGDINVSVPALAAKRFNPNAANYVFMTNGKVNGSGDIGTSGIVAVLKGVDLTPGEPPPTSDETDLDAVANVINRLNDSVAVPGLVLAGGDEPQLIEQDSTPSEQCQ